MFIAYVLKSVKSYIERKAAEAELRGMTDRDLQDLGVYRDGISHAVRHGR